MKRTEPKRRRFALSLIEILVVLSIIALLVAILLPSLSAAREQAKVAKCLSNIRGTLHATQMYLDGDSQKIIPWYRYPAAPGYGVNLFTPSVFGGFKAPLGLADSHQTDSELYPAEIRPLNEIVEPLAKGSRIIDLYKCPSDRSFWGYELKPPPPHARSDGIAAWQADGTSYVLNTNFMREYSLPSGNLALQNTETYGRRIAPHLNGGKASRFITWMEHRFNYLSYRAAPTLAQSQARPQWYGWHRQFSFHSAGFHDGHAEYRYFDNRLSGGDGWTIWEPK